MRKFVALTLMLCILGCAERIPDEKSAREEFQRKFPEATVSKVETLKTNEGEDVRIFRITYSTSDKMNLKTIDIRFWLHGVTNRWVQVPSLPPTLPDK